MLLVKGIAEGVDAEGVAGVESGPAPHATGNAAKVIMNPKTALLGAGRHAAFELGEYGKDQSRNSSILESLIQQYWPWTRVAPSLRCRPATYVAVLLLFHPYHGLTHSIPMNFGLAP